MPTRAFGADPATVQSLIAYGDASERVEGFSCPVTSPGRTAQALDPFAFLRWCASFKYGSADPPTADRWLTTVLPRLVVEPTAGYSKVIGPGYLGISATLSPSGATTYDFRLAGTA
jgi:hypothetical protein